MELLHNPYFYLPPIITIMSIMCYVKSHISTRAVMLSLILTLILILIV